MRVSSFLVGVFSGVVAVASSIMALILITAVAGYHLVLLRWTGAFLFVIAAAHLLPLRSIKRTAGLALYAGVVVAAAAIFGSLYYFATIDDPFRSEGELFEDVPFWLAAFLCVLPLLRACLRLLILFGIAATPTPNQSLDPTAGRCTETLKDEL